MTGALRRAAGAATVLEALWLAYLSWMPRPTVLCPAGVPCPPPTFSEGGVFVLLLLALVVVLFVDGLLGVWGAWFAYPVGAVFSAVALLSLGYAYWMDGPFGAQGSYLAGYAMLELVAVMLGAAGLVANLLAMRAKSRLSEESNPMNLPVFG